MSDIEAVVAPEFGSFQLSHPAKKVTGHQHGITHTFALLAFNYKPVPEIASDAERLANTWETIRHIVGGFGRVEDVVVLNNGKINSHNTGEMRVKLTLRGVDDDEFFGYVRKTTDDILDQLRRHFGSGNIEDEIGSSKARRRERPQSYVNRTQQVSLR